MLQMPTSRLRLAGRPSCLALYAQVFFDITAAAPSPLRGSVLRFCAGKTGAPLSLSFYRVMARITASLTPAPFSLIKVSGVRSNFELEFCMVVMIMSSASFAVTI